MVKAYNDKSKIVSAFPSLPPNTQIPYVKIAKNFALSLACYQVKLSIWNKINRCQPVCIILNNLRKNGSNYFTF